MRNLRSHSLLLAGVVILVAAATTLMLTARNGPGETPPPEPDVTIAATDDPFEWRGVGSIDLYQWGDGRWRQTASGDLRDAKRGVWGRVEPTDRFRKLADSLDGRLRLPTNARPGTYLVSGGDPTAGVIIKLDS